MVTLKKLVPFQDFNSKRFVTKIPFKNIQDFTRLAERKEWSSSRLVWVQTFTSLKVTSHLRIFEVSILWSWFAPSLEKQLQQAASKQTFPRNAYWRDQESQLDKLRRLASLSNEICNQISNSPPKHRMDPVQQDCLCVILLNELATQLMIQNM